MHVHGIQLNPYMALNAVQSAQKAAAAREAEMVRKSLLESASELAGEAEFSEAYVVKLRKDSRRQSKQRNRQNQQDQQVQRKQQEQADSEETARHISGWA
jgi:hypothetical protein